jgi:hypothetical protein
MHRREERERRPAEELIEAFDRQRSKAHDLERRHEEMMRESRERDRQVLIERRRHPR